MDEPATGKKKIQRDAHTITGNLGDHLCADTVHRNFVAAFGTTINTVHLLWTLLDVRNEGPPGAQVVHLLWALMFLKTYDYESNIAGHCKVHRDTYRKWLWAMLKRISNLDGVVSQYPDPS